MAILPFLSHFLLTRIDLTLVFLPHPIECVLLGDIQRSEMGPDDGNVELYERQRLARLNRVWQTLQERVNVFMDSSMGTSASGKENTVLSCPLHRFCNRFPDSYWAYAKESKAKTVILLGGLHSISRRSLGRS